VLQHPVISTIISAKSIYTACIHNWNAFGTRLSVYVPTVAALVERLPINGNWNLKLMFNCHWLEVIIQLSPADIVIEHFWAKFQHLCVFFVKLWRVVAESDNLSILGTDDSFERNNSRF
jgi:hypothetical protein